MAAIQAQIEKGAVVSHVSNVCPKGTRIYLLELGWLECDTGYVIRGGNTSLKSTEGQAFINERRQLPMYGVLIDHPHEGLILWETGSGENYPEECGPVNSDIFARVRYEPQHRLKAAIAATGHRIEDVKTIIIGHLHGDHAGGLDQFIGRKDVNVWVHDAELRAAFWSVATGAEVGIYTEHLPLGLNWKTFDDRVMEFCQGISVHHLPGHTEGKYCSSILHIKCSASNKEK
jgi:glyoxylase-like metal-dependent hydrolase (beta-lactamase superfamily II)